MSLVLKNTCARGRVLSLVLVLGAMGCSIEAGSEEDIASSSEAINVNQFQGWNVIPNGTFTSDPAVTVRSGGAIDVYGRGGDNAIWYNFHSSSTGWIGWTSFGGVLTSEPAVTRWATTSQVAGTESIVAAKGQDNKIWVNPTLTSPGGHPTVQGWRPIPGSSTFASAPAVTFNSPYLYAVARKSDNVIYWTRNNVGSGFTDSGWSAWTAIPNGTLNLRPAITTSGGRVVVAARGGDNRFWFATTTGTTWSNWQPVSNGTFTSGPAISAHGTNNVELSGRGGDNRIWITSLNPTTAASTGFAAIANGTFSSGPASAAVDSSTGVLHVVGRGLDNAYYINKWQ